MTSLAGCSIALVFSASTRQHSIGTILTALVWVCMMVFSGLLVKVCTIPLFLQWIKWFSIFRYSMNVSVLVRISWDEYFSFTALGQRHTVFVRASVFASQNVNTISYRVFDTLSSNLHQRCINLHHRCWTLGPGLAGPFSFIKIQARELPSLCRALVSVMTRTYLWQPTYNWLSDLHQLHSIWQLTPVQLRWVF